MTDILTVAEMPAFPGLDVPQDLWWAYPPPVPLAGMRYPSATFNWMQAAALGFRTVVCLAESAPSYDASPLVCKAVRLEDLIHGDPPEDPEREEALVREAVEAVTSSLMRAEGVLVHCAGGTGRSGAVVGAALVRLGEDPSDVAAWLDRVHKARGRRSWPEAGWQRDVLDGFAV